MTANVVDDSEISMFDRRILAQTRWRRALLFGLTTISLIFAAGLMFDILQPADQMMSAKVACLCLFCMLFLWITLSFWTAVVGFIIQLRGSDVGTLRACDTPSAPLKSRTAIVMPVCNEDVQRVLGGINAIWTSLMTQSEQHAFDFFMLSDTHNHDIATQEKAAWGYLVERHQARGRIFYRRRMQNVDQKSGNIANFIRSWGAAYDYTIVLDADSVMSGAAIVTLARLMEANPRAGIIQTLPLPVGSTTLFGRMLQFAARLNGVMLAKGAAFWHLGHSNYWGHNAILRTQAFAEHCALPRFPGRAPLGGNILSHDFVEAAFMRRAGYQVWLLPELPGSWEGIPSNIVDYVARDRRWVQGNLQHLRILPMRGLHWLSRFHLLTGIMSYVSSAIWFLLLLISSVITCQHALQGHQFFEPNHYMLFPNWPRNCSGEVDALLAITLAMLFLPKLFGAIIAFKDRTLLKGFGGAARLMFSLLLEQFFSTLFAPIMMMFHADFVIRTLLGRSINWREQNRKDRRVSVSTALRLHGVHMLIGAGWGTALWLIVPNYLIWLLPVLSGLLISVPFTVVTSCERAGQRLRKFGLLVTPEEILPCRELRLMSHAPLVIPTMYSDLIMTPPLRPLRMEPVIPYGNVSDSLVRTT